MNDLKEIIIIVSSFIVKSIFFIRFEEAIDPLNRCLRMAGTLKLNVLTWPGTDTKMEESISDELQVRNISSNKLLWYLTS